MILADTLQLFKTLFNPKISVMLKSMDGVIQEQSSYSILAWKSVETGLSDAKIPFKCPPFCRHNVDTTKIQCKYSYLKSKLRRQI